MYENGDTHLQLFDSSIYPFVFVMVYVYTDLTYLELIVCPVYFLIDRGSHLSGRNISLYPFVTYEADNNFKRLNTSEGIQLA
jgi:hypothetical protein